MSLLTRSGYIVNHDDLMPWHVDELTVVAEKRPPYDENLQPFPVFEDQYNGTVSVPRYWGEDNFGRPQKLFGHVSRANRLEFKGELRSDLQKDAASSSIRQLESHGGGVLSLATGFGKTVISLYVACTMKVKTLVVVHKQFLLDQWEERAKTFVPLARIGRLQRDIEDTDNCDIVVGMLQSIAMRQYDDDVFSDFGLVIFDEVHVVPAPVFSRALLKLSAPYLFGLSATPVRRDGLSRVIHWFIGPTFFERGLTGRDNVIVEVVNFTLGRPMPYNMVAATTIICGMTDRNDMIVLKIKSLVSAGHKVIFLSDRRAHCETVKTKLKNVGIDGGLYLGNMKAFELQRSTTKDVLLCTYGIAKEGLDVPALDALVLATPRSDVVQACGRILHGKTSMPPTIVDVVDQWSVGRAQFNKRCVYYRSAGFSVP